MYCNVGIFLWRIYQVIYDGIMDDRRIVFHIHLAEDPAAICAYGLDTQRELIGNFLHRLAGGNIAKDPELPVRKNCVGSPSAFIEDPPVDQFYREDRTDVFASRQDLHGGADQLFGCTLL